MNSVTFNALLDSIKHWQGLVSGEEDEIGRYTCPLCLLFNNGRTPYLSTCIGCPIFEDTGLKGCDETPYPECELMGTNHPFFKEKAKLELAYLENLRDKHLAQKNNHED